MPSGSDKLPGFSILPAMKSGFTMMMILLMLLCSASGQVFPSDSAGGISCFQCHSVNYSDPACHDPFNASLYPPRSSVCTEGRRNQRGTYPGRYCFKIKGRQASDGLEVVVRRCSVDTLVDNTLKSHYGHFKIISNGTAQEFYGAVSMCRFDGCNSATRLSQPSRSWLLTAVTALLFNWALLVEVLNSF